MTYRVQLDLSFTNKLDAETLESHIDSIKAKLHTPTEDEVNDREDLWVPSRFTLIKDYDDENNNQPGEHQYTKVLVAPRKVIKKVEPKVEIL